MTVPCPGAPMTVELQIPEGPGPRGAVVVLCEAFGLDDDLRRIAGRFARGGYLAAIPDLYRGRSWMRCVAGAMVALQRGEGGAVTDLRAVVAALGARDDVDGVGVVGFCMGGGFALLLGASTEARVAGAFYGPVSRGVDFSALCPVFAGYGARDRLMTPHHRRLVAALEAHDVPRDVAWYPDAGHSYMNEAGHGIVDTLARPVMQVRYDPEAAGDSWRRMMSFFEVHLSGTGATGRQ